MKIFFSYSRDDMLLADTIVQALQEVSGVVVERDLDRSSPGAPLGARLRTQISESQVCFFLITLASIKSKWVSTEHSWARQLGKNIVFIVQLGANLNEIPDADSTTENIQYDPKRYQELLSTVKRTALNLRAHHGATRPSIRRAIYPGSFDPITYGHLDIIERSASLFDEVVVALLLNIEKQPMFTTEQRVEMIREVVPFSNVRVDTFEGLLVHYAVAQEARFVVRGIRAISDYEYELQMALMNRRLEPSVETVFLMAGEAYSYVSSRLIKEVFTLTGSIHGLVPGLVEKQMREKLKK